MAETKAEMGIYLPTKAKEVVVADHGGAPSAGLQTLSVEPMRWTYYHLLYNIDSSLLLKSFVTNQGGAVKIDLFKEF